MPSKITAYGRTWKTPDWKEAKKITGEDAEILRQDPPALDTPRATADVLVEEGVSYRLVDELNPADGWCLATQLITHFHIDWTELRQWALEGLLDCATVRGSSVRRYRVHGSLRPLLARAAMWEAGKPQRAIGYGLKPGRGSLRR